MGKPTLKKVSKYENKFAKLQKKAAEFNFRNQLKTVKKKEFAMKEEEETKKKPNWALQNSLSTVSLGKLGEEGGDDGLEVVEKQENIQLFGKLSIKNHKTTKVETVAIMQRAELMATGGQPTAIPVAPTTSVRITDGSGTPAGATANSTPPMDITALTQARIKALTAMADKMGCLLSQLSIAWCLRNSTSQSVIVSASSSEQLLDILGSLPIVAKITHPINEDIEKILGNKPQRPPMISTLQTRWAGTGGVPPC